MILPLIRKLLYRPPRIEYEQILLESLVDKLPEFDPTWEARTQELWGESFILLFAMIMEAARK